jgi:uncharacterized protein (DUF1810 family)
MSRTDPGAANDPFDLNRFLKAQESDFGRALAELKAGEKRSHWMWYIFPQIDGLAWSSTSKKYSIKSLDEARAYLGHPVLGARLTECASLILAVQGRTAAEIMGWPDDLKLRSSATLFAQVSPAGSVFHQLLDDYFQGKPDDKTMSLLGRSKPEESN